MGVAGWARFGGEVKGGEINVEEMGRGVRTALTERPGLPCVECARVTAVSCRMISQMRERALCV